MQMQILIKYSYLRKWVLIFLTFRTCNLIKYLLFTYDSGALLVRYLETLTKVTLQSSKNFLTVISLDGAV